MSKRLKLLLGAAAALLAGALAFEGLRGVAPAVDADFSARDLQGGTWTFSENRGKHPIILSFFATWCAPCRMELPRFVEMKQELPERNLQVVMVALESRDEILADATLRDLPVTWLVDAVEVHRLYNVGSLPRTMYFNAAGAKLFEIEGYSPDAVNRLEKLVRKP